MHKKINTREDKKIICDLNGVTWVTLQTKPKYISTIVYKYFLSSKKSIKQSNNKKETNRSILVEWHIVTKLV